MVLRQFHLVQLGGAQFSNEEASLGDVWARSPVALSVSRETDACGMNLT